jgi:hypothetical protein
MPTPAPNDVAHSLHEENIPQGITNPTAEIPPHREGEVGFALACLFEAFSVKTITHMDFLIFLSVSLVGFTLCSLFYGISKSFLLGKNDEERANEPMHSPIPRINKSRNIYSFK